MLYTFTRSDEQKKLLHKKINRCHAPVNFDAIFKRDCFFEQVLMENIFPQQRAIYHP